MDPSPALPLESLPAVDLAATHAWLADGAEAAGLAREVATAVSANVEEFPQADHKHVDCLDSTAFLSFVTEVGFHCDVWRTQVVRQVDEVRVVHDLVVKCHRGPCDRAYVRALSREHDRLRSELAEIVPPAIFVAAEIDGQESAVVVTENCPRWFNIANPGHEAEVLPMLERMSRTKDQLRRFVRAATQWRDAKEPRIIDLVGEDNLVLTTSRELRYIDSFDVFFYPDMFDLFDLQDVELERRMEISLERINYLERVCREVGAL